MILGHFEGFFRLLIETFGVLLLSGLNVGLDYSADYLLPVSTLFLRRRGYS
jgi:hypothetical protein